MEHHRWLSDRFERREIIIKYWNARVVKRLRHSFRIGGERQPKEIRVEWFDYEYNGGGAAQLRLFHFRLLAMADGELLFSMGQSKYVAIEKSECCDASVWGQTMGETTETTVNVGWMKEKNNTTNERKRWKKYGWVVPKTRSAFTSIENQTQRAHCIPCSLSSSTSSNRNEHLNYTKL